MVFLHRSTRRLRHSFVQSAASRIVEQLESRLMLSVSLDSNGFTQVTPGADSRVIYVSSSTGSDSNSGLSPSLPVASIAKGYSLLRNGEPDQLLFLRGDTFSGAFSSFADSGLSAQEPMVVGSYGNTSLPRPVIDAGSATAFRTGASNQYLDILGLNFTSSTHNPSSPNYTGAGSYGFYDLGGSNDLLIENCVFTYFINDLTIQAYNAPISNVTISRNEILDSYSTDSHSQGLYAEAVTNLTIVDNVFDHDGWNASVSGAGATIFNQDCYLHSSNVNCVVTGNVFADAASFGLEARAGGIVENNLFVGDPYGFSFGLVNGSTTKAGGVSGQVSGNVVLEPRQDASGWGVGAMFGNLAPGGNTLITNNIFAAEPGGNSPAMEFTPGVGVANVTQEVGLNSVTISNNTVYGWGFGVLMSSAYVPGGTGADALNGVVFENNNFQNNVIGRIVSHGNAVNPADESWLDNTYSSATAASGWYSLQGKLMSLNSWKAAVEPTAISETVPFVDPSRTIETYVTSLGATGGMWDFISGARLESASNWNPLYLASAVTSYIQAGFAISGATPVSSSPTSAPTTPIGFNATANSSSIVLNWQDPAADQTGFTLQRATNSGFTQGLTSVSLGASVTSYTDTTAVAGTSYFYQLIATNTAGSSQPTSPVSAGIVVHTTGKGTPGTVAPVLSHVFLNHNSTSNRAAVTSISLVFSQAVTVGSAMVSLVASTWAGSNTIATLISNPSGDGKTWIMSWTSALIDNALASGNYKLAIHGGSIINASGVAVGGNLFARFTVSSSSTTTGLGGGTSDSGGFGSGEGGNSGRYGGHPDHGSHESGPP